MTFGPPGGLWPASQFDGSALGFGDEGRCFVKVRDKVFVVTGGGNGMGRELALGLLSRGARVAAVDIRRESLDETAKLADAGDRLAVLITQVVDVMS